jgi:sulfite reductase alpha subunit-like flavoprotein
MAFLRHMSRMQQADPDHQKTFKGKVVLINGMRADEDELYADECRQYVRDGLLSSYHAVHSATKSETVVTVQNGAVQEAIYDYPAKPYVQAALETHYGHGLEQAVSDRKAIVYVCGALGALEGVVQKWPQCFADKPEALQRTASLPDRYFNNYWQRKTIATHHLEPLPSARRRPETCAWTQRILRISPTSQQQAAHGRG